MKKVILFLIVVLTSSCTKRLVTMNLSAPAEVNQIAVVVSEKKLKCNCEDPLAYIPDDRFPEYQDMKKVLVNFHYPNTESLEYNWHGEEAVEFSKKMINSCNYQLGHNIKMNLPVGNDTPVYDTGYRLELVEDTDTKYGYGVYEDIDEEHWFYIKKGRNKNNYDRTIIKKFAVDPDSVLNFFAMVYAPDSIKSPGFSSGLAGIALGTSLKIAGVKEFGMNETWRYASVSNHEIGHIFGLRHSWYKNDGCNDTPQHPNCWAPTEEGECAGVISNNMMDYNNVQKALTPCQIGTALRTMHKENARGRKVVKKDWCDYNPEKSLTVKQDLELDRAVDMKGDIIVEEGVTLRLSCRTHMPENAKIIIKPGAKLILNQAKIHNDCGSTWGGFEIQSRGDKHGVIEYYGKVQVLDLVDSEDDKKISD